MSSRSVLDHRLDGVGLVRSKGQDQDTARRQNRLQADRRAFGGRVFSLEPFSIRVDGNGCEVEHAAGGILRTPRLVETEVTILPEPQHDDIQPSGFVDATLVLLNALQCPGFKRADSEKLRQRDAPGFDRGAAQEIGSVAWFLQKHANAGAVFQGQFA